MLQKCNLLCQKKKTLYKMKRYHLEVPLPVSFYAASISLFTNNFMYLGIGYPAKAIFLASSISYSFCFTAADVAVLGKFPWFQEFALLKWKDISGLF